MSRVPSKQAPDAEKNEDLPAPWHADFAGERATAFGAQRLTRLRGVELIRDPFLNKGTAFTERERDLLGLRGLLPPNIFAIEEQIERQMGSFCKAPSSIAKYLFLERLHNRNETLYYRFLLENIELTMPIVYTPTVGQACIEFSDMYRSRVRGLYMSKHNRGTFRDICRNWPQHEVDIIVITDGSRILGLGDLGVNGMGIPIGKLALYVAAAGFMPWRTLPVIVDMGTNNTALLESPTYLGSKTPRPEDGEFYDTMQEIIDAIRWRWPSVLIQFEDFSNEHAFGLLDKWFPNILCFNDDIQGTAAVALAGLFASLRIQNGDPTKPAGKLREQRILFLGAGSAGVGVADLMALGMHLEGKAAGEDKDVNYYRMNNFWLLDSKGTVTSTRGDKLANHKIRFAREGPSYSSILETIKGAKPTVLVGLAGLAGGSFTPEIIEEHTKNCQAEGKRPIIFSLSNPTSKSECTAEEAYRHSNGTAVFCSGSPFDPVTIDGKTYETGQGNNMYIFPGVGFGAYVSGATRISDAMFYAVAQALSQEVTVAELTKGRVYPDLKRIRAISVKVAEAVCHIACREGLATKKAPEGGCWFERLRDSMWWPQYEEYVV